MVFPVVMYGCETWREESWVPKNWCFWTVVLEKTHESPLDCKVIQPVHPKGDQSWVFIGRTDAEAETPILWPPHATSWLIGKDPDAGRDGGRRRRWQQKIRCLDGITNSMGMSFSILRELVMDREAWRAAIHEITKSRTQLRDWTELNLSLLQGIFPTQESNQGLLHCRWIPYQLSYQENLFKQYLTALFFLNPFNFLPMPLLDALICCLFPAVFTSIICLFTWALPV